MARLLPLPLAEGPSFWDPVTPSPSAASRLLPLLPLLDDPRPPLRAVAPEACVEDVRRREPVLELDLVVGILGGRWRWVPAGGGHWLP